MKRFLITALLAITSTVTLWAWGGQGHSTVAHIAERYMTKRAKSNVESYIGGRSIVYYASWMDYVRQFEPYVVTTNWHVDYWTDAERTDSEGKPMPPNHVRQINRIVADMKDDFRSLPDSLVTINIKFLVHLVGDMHCPVHTHIDGVKTIWKCKLNGQEWEKFHPIYDKIPGMLYDSKLKADQIAEQLDVLSKKEIKKITAGSIVDWANDAAKVSAKIYDINPMFAYDLDPDTIEKSRPIIDTQLRNAGYRLAEKLNQYFNH